MNLTSDDETDDCGCYPMEYTKVAIPEEECHFLATQDEARDRYLATHKESLLPSHVVLLPWSGSSEEKLGLWGHENMRQYIADTVRALEHLGHGGGCIKHVGMTVSSQGAIQTMRKHMLVSASEGKMSAEREKELRNDMTRHRFFVEDSIAMRNMRRYF